MKKQLRYTLAIILLIGIVFIITITYLNYKVIPMEIYKLDITNHIVDGGFENFDQNSGDCCNSNSGEANTSALKSNEAFEGDYSLLLTSSNHCACINKPINNFNNSKLYLISFYSKGSNPRFCNWVSKDNQCLPEGKLRESNNWTYSPILLRFTNISESSLIFFYADSDGTRTITNLYDDLQVHELIPVTPSLDQSYYKLDAEYVIKTDPANVVGSVCASRYKDSDGNCPTEKLTDDGYYLVRGAPDVTLKFPWTELVLIVVMMLIVIRLLFRKEVIKVEEEIEDKLKKDLKKFR